MGTAKTARTIAATNLVDDNKVIEDERNEIVRRREAAFPEGAENKATWDKDNVGADLAGLALSGGGIRSAMFNLGLMQAFLKSGLFRYFDYLSTVSGGTYIGAHVASDLNAPAKSPDQLLIRAGNDGVQPERVLRFLRKGKYLERPWALVMSYLIGLLLNLVVFTSGLIFACAAVALLWRMVDLPIVRGALACFEEAANGPLHWWTPDLFRVFLPALVLLLLALTSALVARRAANAPLQPAPTKANLPFRWTAVGAALVGVAVCLALVGHWWILPAAGLWLWWSFRPFSFEKQEAKNQRVTHLRNRAQVMMNLARLSGLVSVVVLLGNGDISLGPASNIVPDRWLIWAPTYEKYSTLDVEFLPARVKTGLTTLGTIAAGVFVLAALIAFLLPSRFLAIGGRPEKRLRQLLFRIGVGVLLLGVPLLLIWYFAREDLSGLAARGKLLQAARKCPEGVALTVKSLRLVPEDSYDQYRETRVYRRADPPITTIELAFNESPPWRMDWVRWEREKQVIQYQLTYPWNPWEEDSDETITIPLFVAGSDDDDRTLYLRPMDPEVTLPGEVGTFWIDIFVAKDKVDTAELNWDKPFDAAFGVGGANRLNVTRLDRARNRTFEKPFARRLQRLFRVSDTAALVQFDQLARLQVVLISGAVFLLCGSLLSLNWTSMHRFYRDRLAEAYIEPGGISPTLSGLDNVLHGGPYPLISGTLNLIGFRENAERTWSFLFSPLYSGAKLTKYRSTRDYLGWLYDDLATVTAISGAAVSPAPIESARLAFLMTLFNLRLGQWLPHPENWYRGKLRWFLRWPTAIALLAEGLKNAEDRRLCFVSDGGHSENLGLWPLVQRKCKLIVVSDAGQDETHTFEDFVKLCRRLRIHHNVRFLNRKDDKPVDLDGLRLLQGRLCRSQYFVGKIQYPPTFMEGVKGGPETGYLIYVKPAMTGAEDNDLRSYFHGNEDFPHDPTSNQLYDENTVESYRELGDHIGKQVCDDLKFNGLWEGGKRLAIEEVVATTRLPGA